MEHAHCTTTIREPWNKGTLVGQKVPFKLKEIWAIRVRFAVIRVRDEWGFAMPRGEMLCGPI
jgi:hypothetical protein